MEKVVLDSATLAKLAGHSGPFEIWNNFGQLVGVFHPEKEPPSRPPGGMTDAEIEAAFARPFKRGRRWEEIRDDLRRRMQ